jgi:hypothetical protein
VVGQRRQLAVGQSQRAPGDGVLIRHASPEQQRIVTAQRHDDAGAQQAAQR